MVFDLFVQTFDGSENPANQLVGSISHYLTFLFYMLSVVGWRWDF